MIYNTINEETPMAIIDTVWEPHTFPASYFKPSTIAGKGLRIPHPDSRLHNLVHSVHAHLPWHQNSYESQPEVCPETNIHETAQSYHIGMALAGLSDKNAVLVQWHAPRTLVVTGGLTKAEADVVRQEENVDGLLRKVSVSGNLSQEKKAQPGHVQDGALVGGKTDVAEDEALCILKERRSGPFQRTFTLPADVDVNGCKTKLEHGMLTIDVPKKEPQQKQEERVMFNGV